MMPPQDSHAILVRSFTGIRDHFPCQNLSMAGDKSGIAGQKRAMSAICSSFSLKAIVRR